MYRTAKLRQHVLRPKAAGWMVDRAYCGQNYLALGETAELCDACRRLAWKDRPTGQMVLDFGGSA